MGTNNICIMSHNTLLSLQSLLSKLNSEQRVILNNICDEILSDPIKIAKRGNYKSFHRKVESVILNKSSYFQHNPTSFYRSMLISIFAIDSPSRIHNLGLTDSILKLYPSAFDRLAKQIENNSSYSYNPTNDFFNKDIRFVLGLSIPCGSSQVFDLTSFFPLHTVIRSLLRPGNVIAFLNYFRAGGMGQWLTLHTESRYLSDFNKKGWDASYIRIAEYLERKTSIRGTAGTSWFYDPQLVNISPHLTYLQKRPIENGAFSIRHGSPDQDIKLATLKSKARQRLCLEGKYMPVCYTILWPRDKLISWAKSQAIR